jgi:hypothetical protein
LDAITLDTSPKRNCKTSNQLISSIFQWVMRKHLLPATAEGDTIFLEHKSEIGGFVVQDAYFNPQTCTIFIIFLGALALLLSAQPRP